MSNQAVEEEHATDEVDERAPEEPEQQQQQQASDERGSSLTTWTTVGAVVGATAGGLIGAAVAATLVRRPELLDQAREAIDRDGGRVARAATTAAGGVLAAESIQGLGQTTENGEQRTKLMKQTARQAAAAAAGATRDTIVAIRKEAKESS